MGKGLVVRKLHGFCHCVSPWPASIGHRKNSARGSISQVDVVTFAVWGFICTYHPDGLFFFALGIEAVKKLPGRTISFVQTYLNLCWSCDDNETERCVLK
jgi:hypothetical protein